ncbi:MAG: phenylalanine--tRNA ligase subunit beta [Clostridia bacterium]|nr:phenylalanine--tRNA ligase subunit beta [Clostridia bacterium]
MYISLNWIKDYVDLKGVDVEKLINQFTLSTAEVEGFEYKGKNVSGVIVAQIESVENHPNSKKLHLLKVNTGKEVLDVVCGAPNVRVGLKVAFATPGAQVGDMHIEPAVVGGYTSYGMCCGADELGISDEHWGLLELPDEFELGKDIKEYLDIEDVVFEVDNKSLTNRPDLWGHYGIAREIAALTGRKLKALPVYEGGFADKKLNIKVESPNCYRYTSASVENITAKVSPLNMQIRLYYAGMRAINLLADITNYIMLECGQPMHAFDNQIVKSVEVKDLAQDTQFETLDKTQRTLPKGTMVICTNGEPVAVAGVMGGLNSEITDSTTSVLIESANFNGAPVRKTALALGLRTEASARYEKMLDPELTKIALLRYIYLLKQSDKGAKITSALTDVYNYHYPKKQVVVSKDFIDRFVGVQIEENKILSILSSLEFDVKAKDGQYTINVPTFRATQDIQGKQDIVEEITRIYGYDNLPALSTLQEVKPTKLDKGVEAEYEAKYVLASKFAMHEVHSYIWYDSTTNKELHINPPCVLHIVNALGKENNEIRATMVPTMLKVVLDNKNTYSEFSVFEIGRIVAKLQSDGNADETKSLCIAKYSKSKDDATQLFELKEALEYLIRYELKREFELVPAVSTCEYISPANYYEVIVGGVCVGFVGAIHPKTKQYIDAKSSVVVAELDFSSIVSTEEVKVTFEKKSKFPVTGLDFNFVIPASMNYRDIKSIATNLKTELNYTLSLLDIYEANGVKSYTLHYDICRLDRTLSGAEIDEFHALVISTFANSGINLKM